MSVIDEWCFHDNFHDIENERFSNFLQIMNTKQDNITLLLDQGFKKKLVFNGVIDPTYDEELRMLIDKNKQLRHDIDVRLEELSRQQSKYENYKKDQKLLSQEVKETHEAFLMAKKCYKKFLKVYYSIEKRNKEKQTIFLQFFTEAKKDMDNYSVRLIRDSNSGKYELLNTTPKLNLKELQRRLDETNDVPGVLCSIRGDKAELYRNRKDVFSINTHIVADADIKIRDIVARWPGPVHDSTIFNNSRVKYIG